MKYVVSLCPPAIQSLLEQRPLLAELLDTFVVYLLMLGATGALIWWRVKYYRPKPPKMKVVPEEKPHSHKRRKLGLVGKFLLFCFFAVMAAQLVFFIAVAAGMAIQAASIPLDKHDWDAIGFVVVCLLVCLVIILFVGR